MFLKNILTVSNASKGVLDYVWICNTPGVCHQLSNGFELKHGILSDDEDAKVQPIEMSPNLNLDIAPLLYI